MKLVLLFGGGAVGKMTVGQALAEQAGLTLFHNHMTIEPVMEILGRFDMPTTMALREVIFQAFAKSDNYGMIFTFMWAFNRPEDWAMTEHIADIFRSQGAEIYYVELFAPLEVRLQRNETANRLEHKPSKRDLEASRQRVLSEEAKYRLVSHPGELTFENYIKIDNTHLSPEDVATKIRERFGL